MIKQWVIVTCTAFGIGRANAVKGLVEFQISEDMQIAYGYPAIIEEDKAKMFGGTPPKVLG